MSVANRRPPFWRITTSLSLFVALGIVLALVPGCASEKKSSGSQSSSVTSEKTAAAPVAQSARQASYGVTWMNGSAAAEGTYNLAYVMQGGAPLVIDDQTTGFKSASGTADAGDTARGQKIRGYLMMSPIRAIIGDRTDFVMGMTYDGIMMEGGKPLFTYAYDRERRDRRPQGPAHHSEDGEAGDDGAGAGTLEGPSVSVVREGAHGHRALADRPERPTIGTRAAGPQARSPAKTFSKGDRSCGDQAI